MRRPDIRRYQWMQHPALRAARRRAAPDIRRYQWMQHPALRAAEAATRPLAAPEREQDT